MKQKTFLGLLSCPASRRCLHQRTTRVRPAEWLGEHAIEIVDEVQQLRRKSSIEVNVPRRITFRMITPNTISIWFNHELCFGKYTKRIRWLGSERKACRLAIDFRIPRTPFLPKSVGTSTPRPPTSPSSPSNGCSGCPPRTPTPLRIGGHRLLDMAGEIALRPRRTDRRRDHFSDRHHEVPDQAQRAMTGVLELDPLALPRVIGFSGRSAPTPARRSSRPR